LECGEEVADDGGGDRADEAVVGLDETGEGDVALVVDDQASVWGLSFSRCLLP
jgi:hypothetical protein